MHIAKFKATQTYRMCNHFERQEDDGIRRGNENIHTERTHLNYNLCPHWGESGHQRTKDIIARDDVFVYAKGKRRDLVNMCDVVITAPKSLPQSLYKDFFALAYRFFENRFGVDGGMNVVSSWVHMDETTPHMHFAFVPLVAAGERQRKKGFAYKLSAKAAITLQGLKTLHTDMQEYMDSNMGKGVAQVITGQTEVNKPLYEYKRQKLMEDIAQVEQSLAVLAQDTPKPLNVIHYPAYEKGLLGMAREKSDSWTVAKKDLKDLLDNLHRFGEMANGLDKLKQLSKILHGDVEKELAQEQEKNRELEQKLVAAGQLDEELRELRMSFKIALEALGQVNPTLARAVRVATEDGRDSGGGMASVREMYNAFCAGSSSENRRTRG